MIEESQNGSQKSYALKPLLLNEKIITDNTLNIFA